MRLLSGRFGSLRCPLPTPQWFPNLLDGPVRVDLALHIVWTRFCMMRWYFAFGTLEIPRDFGCWIFVAPGTLGQGHVHLLLASAARNWFRLVMESSAGGSVSHFLPLG